MTTIPPGYVPLREPSFDPARPGRLLALFNPARGIIRIKRNDGPEVTFDLTEYSQSQDANITQTGEGVL